MAGGEPEDVERIRPLMADLAGHFTHLGPVGAGQVAKMINQIIVLTNFCVLAEALKLAENAGIDAARIPEALAGGYADGAMLQKHYPRMLARDFEPPGGYARVVLKDLDMVHDIAKASGTATPMSAQAATLYRLLVARGHGHLDGTAVVKLWDQD
jgi:3-hydroxyisobutyrate dehydrogenase-like beta-hydroxyacid dehydrogenase